MSVLTVLHVRRVHRAAALRAFVRDAARRIADSPLDSTVLRAAPVTSPGRRTTR
ncbi:hypothetical protein [Streptomyces caatingaensis]|uniref:hypothetical protein n=1 Tax=Streptomyces caatingaensis TaxID=1678637 RepID=UPI0012FED01D|nr:hypothetical protein [Streptomyces caatingaensis]